MTTDAITIAIRSVLGDDASPEKIRELDAVLRPIYGAEAALLASASAARSAAEQKKAFSSGDYAAGYRRLAASSEMFEALEEATPFLRSGDPTTRGGMIELSRLSAKFEAALAKARGED
jgi:hypothetical protein